MDIRDGREDDVPGILAIYNDVMATSTAIYREEPATLDGHIAWFRQRVSAGFPVLVAEDARGVAGYASFGDFRQWPGYRYTVEHTVHVRADCRGQGVGAALMHPLIARAAGMGKHVMIAGVDAENEASRRFHERLGFEQVAHFRQVGYKFGRWLDLMFLQRYLSPPGAPPGAHT